MTENAAPAPISPETALPQATAQRMLALVGAIGEYDSAPASHTLTGLLRLAAGQQPTLAERTSLQIAGLVTLDQGHPTITPEGLAVLCRDTESRPQPAAPSVAAADTPRQGPDPIARLKIGASAYEIAGWPDSDALAFRTDAASPWRELEADLAAGWSEIAAEILQRTRNALEEYVRMHMIRRREDQEAGGANGFDLYGLGWEVRDIGGEMLLRLDEETDWRPVRESALSHVAGMRERAAAALVAQVKDLRERIGDDVHAWAKRLAAGALVEPL
ncbi:hypothetical protein ORIO_10295 [Cereibacter azotoformans]|uniref:Uncharacterized protein n=2 Tax=Cereibacter TaxID=1653176 RepID=A0A2T5KCD1_9RHOB|nr:hypothetical protein [Cereibacter azotoformans]AXQ94067.1 hypothetical protein D0Z66_09850 [Cereibacter sphaeroides]MBO4168129.1 hypothetical protein [Cereibacter azotoformans]PTR20066.1 hypothetical protein C8J28_103193 [Cereibacter azotoformans]UIJ29602.1 hypothetical protein LV780_09835 [Cereibacter azotoformans]ULB10287.1 hypothetical protein ORIO_10295 [Cereibacter azotoformans]